MIIDEKHMYPSPPAYHANDSPPPPFTPTGSVRKDKPELGTLPPHILLQIVYRTFPQRDGEYEGEGRIERQRMTLHWLVTSLRLVSRALYIASMHILRSTYRPAYHSLVRPPYSSNPFPSSASAPPSSSNKDSIFPTHRELQTLDTFIALLAHEDLMVDSTELHLPREEAYKDLFDMTQPRTRLEDLVRDFGKKDGIIFDGELSQCPVRITTKRHIPNPALLLSSAPDTPPPSSSPTKSSFNFFSKSSLKASLSRTRASLPGSTPPSESPVSPAPSLPSTIEVSVHITPVYFPLLSASFTSRRASLIYSIPSKATSDGFNGSEYGALSMSVSGPTGPGGRKKTIVEVVRAGRDESLEVTAGKLVKTLREYLEEVAT